MVFESVVVDILNRLLGDYFENLDTSQLKLGIWGGDVVLKDLRLKTSAMDDLGLPFKVVVGKLGSLTMKIPWKKLYTAPVELYLQKLYLLVTPAYSVLYNEEVEEKQALAAKMKALERIEEARKREKQRRMSGNTPTEDTFTEKLITQIIKNVQIRIESIHVRYEDSVTKPESPFAFGITLRKLHVVTTDSNWTPAIITENVHTILKKADLESLAVYWNSGTQIIQSEGTKTEWLTVLEDFVENQDSLSFVLGPLSSFAKVELTPSPDRGPRPFELPKFRINVLLGELALGLTNSQFQDAVELAENIEFMAKAQFYRKYRPAVTGYKNNYKQWWKFAYTCIVEEEVRRKRLNWEWNHMKRHRDLCRTYAEAYYEKLISNPKKKNAQLEAKLSHCEKELDVFNITMLRRQAEVRLETTEIETKTAAAAQEPAGWFSGWSEWFGTAQEKKPSISGDTMEDIVHKFNKALTNDEKKKLYQAIDYSENALPLDYPEAYEEFIIHCELSKLQLTVRDLQRQKKILSLAIASVKSRLTTRPVRSGMRVELTMGSMSALGTEDDESTILPNLITTKTSDAETQLIEIVFDSHPLESVVDKRIQVKAQPIEIVYHADTVNQLLKCFELPKHIQLSKLQEAAMTTIIEWREQSTAGIRHLMETRGELEISVQLIAPYILIPEDGALDKNGSVLVCDLGKITVNTEPRNRESIQQQGSAGYSKFETEEAYVREMSKISYDIFNIELADFHVYLGLPGENYLSLLKKGESVSSPMTLVKFRKFQVQLHQCILTDDPRFPKLKLIGSVPLLKLDIPELRLLRLMKMLITLPLPQSGDVDTQGPSAVIDVTKLATVAESAAISKLTYKEEPSQKKKQDLVEITEMLFLFSMKSILIKVTSVNDFNQSVPFVDIEVFRIETRLTARSFSSSVDVALGGISLRAHQHTIPDLNGPLYLLKTPFVSLQEKDEGKGKTKLEHDEMLLNVHMYSILPNCPPQLAHKVKQQIRADMSSLDITLHLEAIQSFLAFKDKLETGIQSVIEQTGGAAVVSTPAPNDNTSVHSWGTGIGLPGSHPKSRQQLSRIELARRAVMKKHREKAEDVLLEIDAKMERLTVSLVTETKQITQIVLAQMFFQMKQFSEHTLLNMELMQFQAVNLDRRARHRNLVKVDADKVVHIGVVMYDNATKGLGAEDMSKHDMKVKLTTGSPTIVYLAPFINDLLAFLDSFQTAKAAMIEASAAAADVALENVENVYASASRILLDIDLKAPVVLIPRNESSKSALIADLGRITVKNSFSKESHKGHTVILDSMKIKLSDMKISRAVLDLVSEEVKSEMTMLDPPISCTFEITRNLASDWYKDIPAVAIEGELHSTFLRCNDLDYAITMACLNENINAPAPPSTPVVAASSAAVSSPKPNTGPVAVPTVTEVVAVRDNLRRRNSKIEDVKHMANVVEAVMKGPSSRATLPSDASSNSEFGSVYSTMTITLKIRELGVIMYSTNKYTDLEKMKGVVARDDSLSFAHLSVDDVSIELEKKSNDKMQCPITVEQIRLEDVRNKGENHIRNLIQRKVNEDGDMEDAMVLRFNYSVESVNPQSAIMSIETTSLTLVLSIDFLLMVAGFFGTAAPQEHSTSTKHDYGPTEIGATPPVPGNKIRRPSSSAAEIGVSLAYTDPLGRRQSITSGGTSTLKDPEVEEDSLVCFYNLAETEIILVETTERSTENALILNCEISMKQTFRGERSNIMGTISGVRLTTCDYEQNQAYKSNAEVISPMSMTLVMNTSIRDEMPCTLVDMNFSDIFIRLTAGTVNLLLQISASMTATDELEKEKSKHELVDLTDLWTICPNSKKDFWFLRPDALVEQAEDALTSVVLDTPLTVARTSTERLVLESGSIVVTIETGSAGNSVPMLLLETDIDLQAHNWASSLSVSGRLKLEAACYNAKYGLWEFLIEPVETRHHGRVSHMPWEMLFDYSCKPVGPNSTASADDSASDEEATGPATSTMCVSLNSSDLLETTVTRTTLEVLELLASEFKSSKGLVTHREVLTSAYTVVNDTGVNVRLIIGSDNDEEDVVFVLVKQGIRYEECILKPGTSVALALKENCDMTSHRSSVLREQEGRLERLLRVEISDFEFQASIPVNRAEKRFYPLKKRHEQGHYGLLSDTVVKDCTKVVTLRGVVQVHNQLDVEMEIYRVDSDETSAILASKVPPNGTFNIPIPHTYTKNCQLLFAPKGYRMSQTSFSCISLLTELNKSLVLCCKVKGEQAQHFYFKVVGSVRQALYEGTHRKTISSQSIYIILRPLLVFNNLLPIPIEYFVESDHHPIAVDRGCTVNVTNLDTESGDFSLHLRIPHYLDKLWKCKVLMNSNSDELTWWTFKSHTRELTLGIHKELVDGDLTLRLYSPFWIMNRTGLRLSIKGEDKDAREWDVSPDAEENIIFSFPGKLFFSKKRALLRVKDLPELPPMGSDWSDKFSLDVAGSGGFIKCKAPSRDFVLGVEIQLSSWTLTRHVYFTPKYFVTNQCFFPLQVFEPDADDKLDLKPQQCLPFWPKQENSILKVGLNVYGPQVTNPFPYNRVHETLLRLDGKIGGIHVSIHATETSTGVTLSPYVRGQAPALLVNATDDLTIQYSQKYSELVTDVEPGHNAMLCWYDPLVEKRMEWGPKGLARKHWFTDRLVSDDLGHFSHKIGSNTKDQKKSVDSQYYWISFLDGFQRIILFTKDGELVQYLQAARDIETPLAEYNIALQGFGLSLVDTAEESCQEILYMRIASSTVQWECAKKVKSKRFKPLPSAENSIVESAYQAFLNQKAINVSSRAVIDLDNGMQIDFESMKLLKPLIRPIRRSFQTGIWVQYKTFPHSYQFHGKFNRIQIDNQLKDCVFRTVLAPVPPPKSIANKIIKPIAEISIMEQQTAHSTVLQYKYFKILVQEFHVKLDIIFVNALLQLFTSSKAKLQTEMKAKFQKEYDDSTTSLAEFLARQMVAQGPKHFYDFLHFSPLKIHVSFSMGGSSQLSNNFLNLLLASLGVTLTEIQDVIFKLSCLELEHAFLSQEELSNEVYSHYSSQAIKQLYVLVFGLDVLGNPYGLAMGVKEGVTAFFYEPIQGAIQGPGEFAEGLALGVKSLFRSTVGGAAGAISRITGTLGKGIAALTFDEEFQKKRREGIQRQPHDLGEGLARSGKGLVMGFVDGVTGIVTQPVRGAQERGVEGFFKGIGKGAVGLFTRPTAGVVDFASGSFDAVKKATSAGDDAKRMRPPRFIPLDSALQPYVLHEAEGVQLLHELEKGRFANTDTYVAHALINPHGIFVLLLTDKRIFYLKKDELFGSWDTLWAHQWEEFSAPPDIVEKGLEFRLKGNRKSRLFGNSHHKDLIVPIYSANVCAKGGKRRSKSNWNSEAHKLYVSQWLLSKIEAVMRSEAGMVFSDSSSSVATMSRSASAGVQGHQHNK